MKLVGWEDWIPGCGRVQKSMMRVSRRVVHSLWGFPAYLFGFLKRRGYRDNGDPLGILCNQHKIVLESQGGSSV